MSEASTEATTSTTSVKPQTPAQMEALQRARIKALEVRQKIRNFVTSRGKSTVQLSSRRRDRTANAYSENMSLWSLPRSRKKRDLYKKKLKKSCIRNKIVGLGIQQKLSKESGEAAYVTQHCTTEYTIMMRK